MGVRSVSILPLLVLILFLDSCGLVLGGSMEDRLSTLEERLFRLEAQVERLVQVLVGESQGGEKGKLNCEVGRALPMKFKVLPPISRRNPLKAAQKS